MHPLARRSVSLLCVGVLGLTSGVEQAEAGGPLRRDRVVPEAAGPLRRDRVVRETVDRRPENQVAPSPMLGTFRPTPVITVRGNGIIGGGYAPLGLYGANYAMTLYGPISSLRSTAAPVNTVVRGYNGTANIVEGTSLSTPFQPDLSPVKYPTRASNYGSLRGPGVPTRSGSGIMWVDQN